MDVIPFCPLKAKSFLYHLSEGLPKKKILAILDLTETDLIKWRMTNDEFDISIAKALEFRRGVIIDKSYEEDILAAYDEGEDKDSLDIKLKRASLVDKHIRTSSPKDFNSESKVNIDLRGIIESADS